MLGRRRNCPFVPNGFEQCDLAGTYVVTVSKMDTDGKPLSLMVKARHQAASNTP